MRLPVQAYESLLRIAPVRGAVALISFIEAKVARRLRGSYYLELASLLRAWRALQSVGPGTVPGYIKDAAIRRTRDLDDPASRARYHKSFLKLPESSDWQNRFRAYGVPHMVRLRLPRQDDDPQRQGDLILLKPPLPDGEKGVLMVMYSPSFAILASVYDLDRLASRYRIVLEPSTWGYQDPDLLLFLGLPTDVIVQSQFAPDFDHVASIGNNLLPVRIGAGDWADPARFDVASEEPKRFDVVMVASWLQLKRHWLLFKAIRDLGKTVSAVALVGMPSGNRTIQDVRREARAAGVMAKINWFENLPHWRVCEVLRQSRTSVMLSTREGASRVIYESFFCDVPVIVSSGNIGVNRDHINEHTGLFAKDAELAGSIAWLLDNTDKFSPRAWALRNTGYPNATREIQQTLKALALRDGEPWTQDILPKMSAPNLRYASTADWASAQPWYDELERYLRAEPGRGVSLATARLRYRD